MPLTIFMHRPVSAALSVRRTESNGTNENKLLRHFYYFYLRTTIHTASLNSNAWRKGVCINSYQCKTPTHDHPTPLRCSEKHSLLSQMQILPPFMPASRYQSCHCRSQYTPDHSQYSRTHLPWEQGFGRCLRQFSICRRRIRLFRGTYRRGHCLRHYRATGWWHHSARCNNGRC
jgi:hypothetical protein